MVEIMSKSLGADPKLVVVQRDGMEFCSNATTGQAPISLFQGDLYVKMDVCSRLNEFFDGITVEIDQTREEKLRVGINYIIGTVGTCCLLSQIENMPILNK